MGHEKLALKQLKCASADMFLVLSLGPLLEPEPLLTNVLVAPVCRVCWDPFTSVTSSDVSYFYQVFYYPELEANISSRETIASPVTSKIPSAVGPSISVEITNVSLTVGPSLQFQTCSMLSMSRT